MTLKKRLEALRGSWMSKILTALSVLACLFFGVQIARGVTQESPLRLRESDRAVARRNLHPERDEVLALPEGQFVGGNGVIEPRGEEVEVSASISGRITNVLIQVGDHVSIGQALIEFEKSLEESDVRIAQAELESAQAELSLLASGSRSEDVVASQAEVTAAESRVRLAEDLAMRTDRASSQGAVSESEQMRNRLSLQTEQASLEVLRARALATRNGTRRQQVVAAAARTEAARARLQRAQEQLALRTVRALTAGEVLDVLVRPGEFFQAGGFQAASSSLLRMGDTSQLFARVEIDEREVGGVQVGGSVILRAPAYPDHDFQGRVVQLGRRMGRKKVGTDAPNERNDTRVLEVLVQVNADEQTRLLVGQRVSAYLQR